MNLTCLDLAIAQGAMPDRDGTYSRATLAHHQQPDWIVCDCGATVSCAQAYPTRAGWIVCRDCLANRFNGEGFARLAQWMAYDYDWLGQFEGGAS